MSYLIIYILVGLIFSCMFVMDDDRRVISNPLYTIIMVVFWPIFVWYYSFRVKVIRWKGKVIWERKK